MSTKKTKAESNNELNAQSNNFELSSANDSALTFDSGNGFSLWMLNPSLWLPTTRSGFIRFFVFIAILVLGSTVNIYLSAQISEAQLKQRSLEEEYLAIQQQNAQITWQIAEHTSLDQIRQRAVNIGYVGTPSRSYAISPISDDALAALDATILAADGISQGSRSTTAQAKTIDQIANGSAPSNSHDGSSLNRDVILTANISANRLIENGVLDAMQVINGR